MKTLMLSTLCFAALASCNSTEKASQTANENMPSGRNEMLVKQYFEHFNKHEWTEMAAMYKDSAEFKDPSLGKGVVWQTREETARKYAELAQIFPDIKDSVVNVYPSGADHVTVEFVSTGTAPDNSKMQLPICTVFSFEDGLITRDYTYYDQEQN